MTLYKKILDDLRGSESLKASHSVLVVCGGGYDAQHLSAAGLTNILVTNLDTVRASGSSYPWEHADAEALTYADQSFDWVIVNAGLHHCRSPHQALVEMYRVARVGVVVIEARDCLMMRAAVRFGFVPRYEFEAVAIAGYTWGGLRNGPVPNFIYRWTEREVVKTIESAFPDVVNQARYFYGITLPTERLTMAGPVKRVIAYALIAGVRLMQLVLPKQCNVFGFVIERKGDKAWIQNGALRRDYALGFDPAKYVRE